MTQALAATELATDEQRIEAENAFGYLESRYGTKEKAWLACGWKSQNSFRGMANSYRANGMTAVIPLRMYRSIMHTYLIATGNFRKEPQVVEKIVEVPVSDVNGVVIHRDKVKEIIRILFTSDDMDAGPDLAEELLRRL